MASEWFYQVMGKQVGPVSSVELRNLAQAGTVTTQTPVANAPSGPWVSAGRVNGLFALPNGAPPPAATTGTAQVPPPHAAASEESSGLGTATKIMLGVCGGVCVLVVAFLVWSIASRDTWELDNASRVSAKLDEADRLQQSDPLTAYKTYDEVLKEVKQHKITDEQFAQKLANAEKARTALYPKVQEKIQAEEAEKQRLAQEEARRAEEEKRIKEAIAAYRNVPQSARNALNAVKKVEARTEVSISYKDYPTVVGEAWADVKIFTESPEGKKLPEFSFLLVSAMGKYKFALDVWRVKVEDSQPTGILNDAVRADMELARSKNPVRPGHELEDAYLNKRAGLSHTAARWERFSDAALRLNDALLQQCWGAAHRRIDMAGSLIGGDDIATVLLRVVKLQKTDVNGLVD